MVSLNTRRARQEAHAEAQSMMFAIEDAHAVAIKTPQSGTTSSLRAVERLSRCRTTYERQASPHAVKCVQLKDDVLFYARQADADGPLDIVELACSLAAVGHGVTVRQAVGGGQNCFKNLYHEFLLVRGADDCAGADIVVECSFRSHFRIACPTAAYLALLEAVPEVFVGTVAHMLPLVEVVTQELAAAFAEAGVTMPPWRSARSVMSKWAPQRATDRLPSSGGASPTAAPPMGPWLRSTSEDAATADGAPGGASDGGAPGRIRAGVIARPRSSAYGRQPSCSLGERAPSGGSPVLSVKFGFASPSQAPVRRTQ